MHCSPISSFILSSFCSPQDHHSFPTRRSSDLIGSQLKQFARMKPLRLPPARLGLADIAILCLLGGVIAVVVSFARERSEEHTSELQSHSDLVCRLLLEKKKSVEECGY